MPRYVLTFELEARDEETAEDAHNDLVEMLLSPERDAFDLAHTRVTQINPDELGEKVLYEEEFETSGEYVEEDDNDEG